MPHEVIMPALGMAQETGLIVSWMKQPGDAVKTGDPLMEVETDKATMEVEAQADGYLTDLRYDAGQEVPVGEVIALISDTAASSGAKKPDAQDENEEPAPASASAPVEGAKVIMPALGMAQDTGLIVAWLKSPGDAVAADDVLLEVETDKSTMEVPAGHDGYIAALHAEAGQEVPVGDVIAVISTEKPANPVQSRAPAPGADKKVATPAKAEAPPKRSVEAPAPRPSAPAGRILASPKARRLAAEQGLDLARLVEAGHPQPYHAADLELLRDLPPTHAPTAAQASAVAQITARASRSAIDEFLAWSATEGVALERGMLWAAFAAAALRRTSGVTNPLVVELSAPGVAHQRFVDPDLSPLSACREADSDGAAALLVRDLTGSLITGIRTGVQDRVVLSIAADGERLLLTLDFTPSQLTESAAINLVTEFAARLSDPRRHLL